MAGTSFKKVLSEPFVKRMIIGHDNAWHATCGEAASLFVKPLVCVLTICIADRQRKMAAGSYVVIQG